MKTIDTLIEDIYGLFGSQKEFDMGVAAKFGELMANTVATRVPSLNGGGTLRMSNMGRPCERKLWYEVNEPECAIPLTPATRFKFLYGDILEELVLYLAAEAGHRVEGLQDEMEIDGVIGHRDAVIDGVLVDVKSAAPFSFKKFEKGLTLKDDAFGYITQIQQYLYASQNDPVVEDKDRAAFLVVDKVSGALCLDIHKRDGKNYGDVVRQKRDLVNSPEVPPRRFAPVESKTKGNLALGLNCNYCDFRRHCWPTLRTFKYSNYEENLVKVVNTPRVEELKW